VREPDVKAHVRRYLEEQGYVVPSHGDRGGPDIIAKKDGKRLIVEVKGDRPGHRSSPGTIYVDVCTLLGQIVLRKGEALASEYAVAIRPVHKPLVDRAMAALKELSVRIFLVGDDSVREV